MKQWMVALALVLVLGGATPSHAATQEVRVLAVGNDNSSLKADEKALEYARKRAVYLAARKLGVKDPSGTVAKFTDKQFADIIRGANVVKTRRDGTITYSEVNVTIVDGPLRRALKLPELPEDPADKLTMRAVLLLPLYVAPSRAYLWEKENLLREPLADEIRRQARGGILLPGGDLEDLRLIDYQNALTVKPEELKPMFDRYGAEEIIIAVLTPGASGTMDASSVLLRRLKIDGSRNEVIEIPPETAEEISSVRLAKSASAIANAITQIASSTAERDQLLRNKSTQIPVRFAYAIPKDLAFMIEAVRNSPEVLSLDLPTIGLAQVTGTIYLKGDEATLKEALIKQGVIVTVMSKGWRLSVR